MKYWQWVKFYTLDQRFVCFTLNILTLPVIYFSINNVHSNFNLYVCLSFCPSALHHHTSVFHHVNNSRRLISKLSQLESPNLFLHQIVVLVSSTELNVFQSTWIRCYSWLWLKLPSHKELTYFVCPLCLGFGKLHTQYSFVYMPHTRDKTPGPWVDPW